jgi:hypothetical protein
MCDFTPFSPFFRIVLHTDLPEDRILTNTNPLPEDDQETETMTKDRKEGALNLVLAPVLVLALLVVTTIVQGIETIDMVAEDVSAITGIIEAGEEGTMTDEVKGRRNEKENERKDLKQKQNVSSSFSFSCIPLNLRLFSTSYLSISYSSISSNSFGCRQRSSRVGARSKDSVRAKSSSPCF